MVLGAIFSVQLGAAIATKLFDRIGPSGVTFLRSALAAVMLAVVARESLKALRRSQLRDVVIFGLILAAMNLCFYEAIDRLPLGVVVALEFLGPLGVAVFGSRRRRDLIWVAIAALGVLLLTDPFSSSGIDATGTVLALTAGALWAAYIVQSARVGASYPGLSGIASATAVAGVVLIPIGVAQGGADLLDPGVIAAGFGVGLLSTALPYSLELEALRRLPKAVFGVLMSLEPAVAALIGFVALSQDLSAAEVIAIGLVVAASAGAMRSAATPPPRDA